MKRLAIAGTLALLATMLITASAFAFEGDDREEPWTGEPDPFACNQFQDCWWTLEVCIDGVTYEVGIYYDPVGVDPEKIAEDALYWTETVLTAGACPPGEPYFPCVEAEGPENDTLLEIATNHFGGPSIFWNNGLGVFETAVGDWGQGESRRVGPSYDDNSIAPGDFVCLVPPPDTGAGISLILPILGAVSLAGTGTFVAIRRHRAS